MQKFKKAAEDVKNLTKKPTDEELLIIYGLFKQGSIGDVNTGIINIIKHSFSLQKKGYN